MVTQLADPPRGDECIRDVRFRSSGFGRALLQHRAYKRGNLIRAA
jgi:hypothetical protein